MSTTKIKIRTQLEYGAWTKVKNVIDVEEDTMYQANDNIWAIYKKTDMVGVCLFIQGCLIEDCKYENKR